MRLRERSRRLGGGFGRGVSNPAANHYTKSLNQYAHYSPRTVLMSSPISKLSVAARITLDSVGTYVIVAENSDSTFGWSLYLSAEPRIYFMHSDNGAVKQSYVNSGAWTIGQEYHVAAVYEGDANPSPTIAIYRDGVLKTPITTQNGLPTTINGTNEFTLAADDTLHIPRLHFDGVIKDVALQAAAWTGGEVATMAAGGAPPVGATKQENISLVRKSD